MMKRFNTAAVILMIACWAHGVLPAQVLWFKNFNPPIENALWRAALNHKGNISVLGYHGPLSNGLYEISPAGFVLDTFVIPGGQFTTFTTTSDKGYAFYGVPGFSFWGEYLVKVDSSMNVLWQIPFSSSLDIWPEEILEAPDGKIVTMANQSSGGNFRDILVRKFNAAGNLIWTKVTGSGANDDFCSMTLLENGDVLVVSSISASGQDHFRIERIDLNGNSVWVKTYSKAGAIPLQSAPIGLPDGGFLIFGSFCMGPDDYSCSVFRFDMTGNFIWERPLTTTSPFLLIEAMPIKDQKGGYSLAFGTRRTFGNMQHMDIAIMHVDTLGNPLSIHRVGHPKQEYPTSLVQLSDTNYVVVGYSNSFSPTALEEGYIAKVRHDSCGREFYFPPFPQRDTLCNDDTLVLDAGPGFAQYLWSTGDTGRFLSVTQPDTFFVQGIDPHGCVYTSWSSMVLMPDLQPTLSYVVNGLTVDFESNNIGQWYFGDGTSLFANDPTHTYATPGIYEVCIKYEGAYCDSVIRCDSVWVGLVSNQSETTGFQVFPNPAKDLVQIKASDEVGFECELWDATGRLLKKEFGLGLMQFDLQKFPLGIYTIRILPQDGTPPICRGIVVQR